MSIRWNNRLWDEDTKGTIEAYLCLQIDSFKIAVIDSSVSRNLTYWTEYSHYSTGTLTSVIITLYKK